MSLTATNTTLEAVLVIQGNNLTIENPDNALGMTHTYICTVVWETASHAGHHRSTNLVNVQLKLNCIQSIYGQDIKIIGQNIWQSAQYFHIPAYVHR